MFVSECGENAFEIHQTEDRIGVDEFHLVEQLTEKILVDIDGQGDRCVARARGILQRIPQTFVEFLVEKNLRVMMRLDTDQTTKELASPVEQQRVEILHGRLNAGRHENDEEKLRVRDELERNSAKFDREKSSSNIGENNLPGSRDRTVENRSSTSA